MENINFDNLFNNLKDNKTSTFRDHLNLVKAHWLLILMICFIVSGATIVYSLMATDIYVASTEVKITTPPGSILETPVMPRSMGLENNLIANELQTILNQTIRAEVAESLVDTFKASQKKGDYSIILNSGSGFGNTKQSLKEYDEILSSLNQNVVVYQKGTLDFIEIAVESPSPNEAALIANLYAKAYQNFNLAMNRNQLTTIKETLDEQRAEKLTDLVKAENNIKSYQLQGGVIQLDAQANALIGEITQFEARRYNTQIEMNATKETLDKYKKELSERDPSLIQYLENKSSEPYLQQLQQQIAQLEASRDMAILNNPAAKDNSGVIAEFDKKITELKVKLNSSIAKYKEMILTSSPEEIKALTQRVFEEEVKYQSMLSSYNQLGDVLGNYEQKFSNLPTRTLDLARLERERAVHEKLYLTLEEKYQEALINEQSIPSNVIIMNTAWAPNKPSKPNRAFIIILGVLAGLGLGLGYVYIKHSLDKTIKTPEDIEKSKLKFLTWIPKVRKGKKDDDEFIMLTNPDNIIGESFRALRTRVQFSKPGREIKSILVTSCAPAEGKTLTAVNLAGSFARDDKKTIIVDCDLRKPRVHSIMREELAPGLTDYLFGKVTLENVIKMTKLTKLDFIPAGTIHNASSEILNSKKLISLLQTLKETYDIIIVDTPPILAVSDTEVVSNFVDASMLVVSSNSTELEWANQAVDLLKHDHNIFLGVVLNNYDFKFGYPSSYKYHSYYYSNDETKKGKR